MLLEANSPQPVKKLPHFVEVVSSLPNTQVNRQISLLSQINPVPTPTDF
jgi:hypothetical protein